MVCRVSQNLGEVVMNDEHTILVGLMIGGVLEHFWRL